MKRLYHFITVTGHVSERASLASLLVMLRERSGKGLDLVDYDEATRRIVLRLSPTEIGFVKSLLGVYLDSATFEVKAKTRGRIDKKSVRALGGKVEPGPPATLAIIPCSTGLVFVEQKGRELLLKYCRRGLALTLPSELPPSMCSFNPFENDMLDTYERGRKCFEEVVEKLVEGTVEKKSEG